MITAILKGKLKKFIGKDTHQNRWYDSPIYKYEIHTESSKYVEYGHNHIQSDGDFIVYRLSDSGWARATIYPLFDDNQAMKSVTSSDGFTDVATISGVVDFSRTQVGTTKWDIEVDIADRTITDVSRTEIRF